MAKSITFLMLIGLAIRLIVAPFTGHVYDISYWAGYIGDIEAGYLPYEAESLWYPPVWGYILAVIGYLLNLVGAIPFDVLFLGASGDGTIIEAGRYAVTTPVFNLAVKIPLILSDLVVGWLIYKFVKERTLDKKKARFGLILWLFCPLTIFMSAIHCQFETLCVLFMIMSFLLMFRKSYFLSGVTLSLAIMIKVFPIFLLILMLAYILFEKKDDIRSGYRNALYFIIGIGITAIFILIPVIQNGELSGVFNFFTSRVGIQLGQDQSALTSVLQSVKMIIPISAVALMILIFTYLMCKTDVNREEFFFKSALLIVLAFFILPISGFLPQYYVMVIPLIVIITLLYKDLIPIWILISVTSTVLCISYLNWMYPLGLMGFIDMDSLNTMIQHARGIIDIVRSASGFIYAFIGLASFIYVWKKFEITPIVKGIWNRHE